MIARSWTEALRKSGAKGLKRALLSELPTTLRNFIARADPNSCLALSGPDSARECPDCLTAHRDLNSKDLADQVAQIVEGATVKENPKAGRTAWVVRTRSADPSYEESMGSTVYEDEETLKKEVSTTIEDLLKRDMEDYELSSGDEEAISEILETLKSGKFWDAISMYEGYVGDTNPVDYIEIEETSIRQGRRSS